MHITTAIASPQAKKKSMTERSSMVTENPPTAYWDIASDKITSSFSL